MYKWLDETADIRKEALDEAPTSARSAINFTQRGLVPGLFTVFFVYGIWATATNSDIGITFYAAFAASILLYILSLMMTLPHVWQYYKQKNSSNYFGGF